MKTAAGKADGHSGQRRDRRLRLAGGLCLAVGICCFLLPGFRFSGGLFCLLAAAFFLAVPFFRWAERSRRGPAARRVVCGVLIAGLSVFLAVEGVLIAFAHRPPPENTPAAVIVLGAGVNGERPSLILQSRIDAAADYLTRHPEAFAVLSGGQGGGEAITEAEAMRRALKEAGISEGRLLLEEQSSSTAENFSFSAALLRERGLALPGEQIAVVTSDFHCFRAAYLARRQGLEPVPVPARAPWAILNANYYVREFFALGKTILFDGAA